MLKDNTERLEARVVNGHESLLIYKLICFCSASLLLHPWISMDPEA